MNCHRVAADLHAEVGGEVDLEQTRALQTYWERRGRGDAEQPLKASYAEASKAAWKSPEDIKAKYRSASFVADNRVVFNIAGNKHRLVVHLNYELALC